MVIVCMILGYKYGLAFSGFYAAVYAALGSVVGLVIATAIIVETVLYWDKHMLATIKQRQVRKSVARKYKRE